MSEIIRLHCCFCQENASIRVFGGGGNWTRLNLFHECIRHSSLLTHRFDCVSDGVLVSKKKNQGMAGLPLNTCF
jgi:hypothetical protein